MEEIDLKDLLKEFWDRRFILFLIVIVICIGMTIMNFYIERKTNTFVANTTILLTDKKINQEKNDLEQELNSIMSLIKSDIMIEEIKNKTNFEIRKEDINVENENNIIRISVTHGSEENVIIISNIIIDKLMERTFAVFKTNAFDIEVIDFPENSCKKNRSEKSSILKYGILTIIASFSVVFIKDSLDTKIKSKDKIEREFCINVIEELKVMKKENNSMENELTTIFDFKSENSKLFKIIVTKILNKISNNEPNLFMITSPNNNEGKTYVASNIGTVLAMFGKKVIILDTNFEKSKLDKIFKVPNTLGLSNYLTGINGNGQEIKETLNNFIQETDIKNLNIITAGDIKENITNCLVTERFDEFIKQLKFYYDFIIIDSDKILNNPNSLTLSNKANNIILVVDKNSTKMEELEKINNDIKEVNGNLLGVIINETAKKNIVKVTIEEIKNKKKNDNKMLEETFYKE